MSTHPFRRIAFLARSAVYRVQWLEFTKSLLNIEFNRLHNSLLMVFSRQIELFYTSFINNDIISYYIIFIK